jgi:hypothetical protein
LSTYETTATGPSSASTEASDSTAQQAKDKAQETAQQAAGQAKSKVRDQIDQRSTDAGERVSSMAADVRSVGDELRKQGKDQPAKLAEQAAQRAESLGDYLQRADGDTILSDLEDFGRRRPWAVIAGGVVLGVAASRFLKASGSRRYESNRERSGRLPVHTPDISPAPGPRASELVGTGAYTGETGDTRVGVPARDPRIER